MLYIALLHYPIYNKEGKVVTTAIANLDIHDLSRLSRTYGVRNFYVVNPIEAQLALAAEIIGHWRHGYGASFNPCRSEALALVRLSRNLEEVEAEITRQTGIKPRLVVTSAKLRNNAISFLCLKDMIRQDGLPYLLIFGTGWGLAEEIMNRADFCLESVRGCSDYNHLSVRSAASIVLDRIIGEEFTNQ